MRNTADVVIVGAGVQGLSAAYHIARLGIANVVVVEKESIGAGSSGRSASMLMMQRENEHKIRLSQYSYGRYMRFKEEVGLDPGFRMIGFLSVVPQSSVDESLERARTRQRLGVITHILSPEEVKSLVPVVNVDDILFGVFGPEDGVIDAHSIMMGYAAAARRLGAEIRQGVGAVGITVKNHRVLSVETTEGSISAPFVVNAAGGDAVEVAGWVGIRLPITNRRRNIYITDEFPRIPDNTPMVEDAEAEWYYRKEGAGVLMGMGKEESGDIAMTPNWDFLQKVVEFAVHRVPVLGDARVVRGWSGIRPLTADANPILGKVEEVQGFVNSCGWGGEGIMHAPAGGQIVAECVAGTENKMIDPAPFLLSRFKGALDDQEEAPAAGL